MVTVTATKSLSTTCLSKQTSMARVGRRKRPVAPTSSSEVPAQLLGLLSSVVEEDDAHKRAKSIHQIISFEHILAHSAFENEEDNGHERNDEEKVVVDYLSQRLVRGLASSRRHARRAFATTLTEALRSGKLQPKDLMYLVEQHLSPSDRDSPTREAHLGRLFLCGALLFSGSLRTSPALFDWVASQLNEISHAENVLAEACLHLAVELLAQRPGPSAALESWARRDSPDGAALRMLLEPTYIAPSGVLVKWFEYGFPLNVAPQSLTVAVKVAGERKQLAALWQRTVEPLLHSNSREKRATSAWLLPVAIAACRDANDMRSILNDELIPTLSAANIRPAAVASAVLQASSESLLPLVTFFAGRGGGFEVILEAAGSRMGDDLLIAVANAAKGWTATRAAPALAAIWRGHSSRSSKAGLQSGVHQASEGLQLLIQTMYEVDRTNDTALRTAAQLGPQSLEQLWTVVGRENTSLSLQSSDEDGESRHVGRALSLLRCGIELSSAEGLDDLAQDIEVENGRHFVARAIVRLLSVPNAALRSVATLAFEECAPYFKWTDIELFFAAIENANESENADEDGEESDDDEHDDTLAVEALSGDEDSSESSINDESNAEEGLRGDKSKFRPIGTVTAAEPEEADDGESDIDPDAEDPEVLARFDEALAGVVRNVRSSQNARLRQAEDLRRQTQLKLLEMFALYAIKAIRGNFGSDTLVLMAERLMKVSTSHADLRAKIDQLVRRRILRSPRDLTRCGCQTAERALNDALDLTLTNAAARQTHFFEFALRALFSVALHAGVSMEKLAGDVARCWQAIVDARRPIGIRVSFLRELGLAYPSLVLNAMDPLRKSAIAARTSYLQEAAASAMATVIKAGMDRKAETGMSNLLRAAYVAGEDAFVHTCDMDVKGKPIRLKEVALLGSRLFDLRSLDDIGVKRSSGELGAAVEKLVKREDLEQSAAAQAVAAKLLDRARKAGLVRGDTANLIDSHLNADDSDRTHKSKRRK